MTNFLLLLSSLSLAASRLPPEPAPHLTPPQVKSSYTSQPKSHSTVESQSEKLVRWLKNDSSKATDGPKPSESEKNLEPHQQEARAIIWAAPAIPILSSHRGRSSENCKPCDRVPWVPMARALDTQQYALSLPTIQLTLPVNYGIPITQMRPPQQYGPPPQHSPQQHGHPSLQGPQSQEYKSPQHGPHSSQGPQSQQYKSPQHGPLSSQGPQSQQYKSPQQQGIPKKQGPRPHQPGIPPQKYNSPPQQRPLAPQYGPPLLPPATGSAKENVHPQKDSGIPEDEKPGLPPPPLPQRFTSPLKTYGTPQLQHTSATNINPSAINYLPPSAPPIQNYPLDPSIKFGYPFDPKLIPTYKPPSKPPINYVPANSGPANSARPVNHEPQQYQQESVKTPVFIQKPILFPTLSKSQLPPLFNYQTFNDGKHEQLHPYLQPPKPQSVVFTITETDDICKKCREKSQVTDSEPAQAEHVTENLVKTTMKYNGNTLDHQKSNVQIVKSVPLAEYLASVEYPMQIIQAPILDVPDLTKYFNLGYHNFPQVNTFHGNDYKVEDQKPAQSFIQSNHQITENSGLQNSNVTSNEYTSKIPLDNVDIPEPTQTTNSLPHNHKPNIDTLGKYQETTEKGYTSSPFSQTTTFHTTSTRPSQIFHISKVKPVYHSEPTRQTTVEIAHSQAYSTTAGHYVTSQPITDVNTELQPPSRENPVPFHEFTNSYAMNHRTNSSGSLKHGLYNPSPPSSESVRDWALQPYGRGWGNTLPQPFVMPTDTPYRARFVARPAPDSAKKPKHIHQIIVPYTTNKHTPVAQEPTNNLGWTPIPPTNQGRKVPTNLNFHDKFPSTTGLDQIQEYPNNFPSGDSPSLNIHPRPSGQDNLGQQILPINNGQPLNLPPHVINQILHLNQQGAPLTSGPEGLQQLLVTNLQGLLRGEEDSVDFARLQKNIDNWTAEGYKQNSPSVNFIPVTTIPHIFNSKKIPDEYLTSTEPTVPSNSSQHHLYENYQHNVDSDHEGAESQKHQVKVHPQVHSKDYEEPEDTTDNIDTLLNGWSLLETKVTTSSTQSTATPTTEPTTEVEPTSKVWEKIQVSISPLTHEKVYVVTPVPLMDSNRNHTESTHSSQIHSETFQSSQDMMSETTK